jgi:hypothetical protein
MLMLGVVADLVRPHAVLLAGDEEYRSEEMLPQLAKILERNGFRCTVLFSTNDRGEIDPEEQTRIPGIAALQDADLCIMMLRFRNWADSDMVHFVKYWQSGRPIVALRTSTHAFRYPVDSSSDYKKFSFDSSAWDGGFGKQVLGETWVSHWGNHGAQGTRGIPSAQHPILKDVADVFSRTDVYEVHVPVDAAVLMRGIVTESLDPSSAPAKGSKKTVIGEVQDLNDPAMPLLWLRGKHVVTTLGTATDLLNPGIRRLLVNACRWSVQLPTDFAEPDLVGEYRPSEFGFGKFLRGRKG